MSKKKEVVSKYPFPSRFGSHQSMVVEDIGETVKCKDEFGEYLTLKSNLDNGLADKNRTSQKRLGRLFDGSAKKEEKAKGKK